MHKYPRSLGFAILDGGPDLLLIRAPVEFILLRVQSSPVMRAVEHIHSREVGVYKLSLIHI